MVLPPWKASKLAYQIVTVRKAGACTVSSPSRYIVADLNVGKGWGAWASQSSFWWGQTHYGTSVAGHVDRKSVKAFSLIQLIF